jgi:hypothetical protein
LTSTYPGLTQEMLDYEIQVIREFVKASSILLTNKAHRTIEKNNIKPLITRMNTDMKKLAREVFAARIGQDKNKNSASGLARVLLFSGNPGLLGSSELSVVNSTPTG